MEINWERNFGGILGEKLRGKLGEKLGGKLGEKLRGKLGGKLRGKLVEKLGGKLRGKLRGKVGYLENSQKRTRVKAMVDGPSCTRGRNRPE